jgi:hypothetical protein
MKEGSPTRNNHSNLDASSAARNLAKFKEMMSYRTHDFGIFDEKNPLANRRQSSDSSPNQPK